jgi:hypothetical protein
MLSAVSFKVNVLSGVSKFRVHIISDNAYDRWGLLVVMKAKSNCLRLVSYP